MSLPVVVAKLQNVPGGYAYFPADVNGLKRDDGSPAQPGDVLSAQPDGTLQTRAAHRIASWETATLSGVVLVYATDGTHTILVLPPGL